MKPAAFRGLVQDGVLPKPTKIGSYYRWGVKQPQAIVRGDAVGGLGEGRW